MFQSSRRVISGIRPAQKPTRAHPATPTPHQPWFFCLIGGVSTHSRRHLKCVQLLLKHGARADGGQNDAKGQLSPLELAARNGDLALLEELLTHPLHMLTSEEVAAARGACPAARHPRRPRTSASLLLAYQHPPMPSHIDGCGASCWCLARAAQEARLQSAALQLAKTQGHGDCVRLLQARRERRERRWAGAGGGRR